jgi:hypothetical protein
MEKIYIYTLSDNLGVRYIGKTKDIKTRLYRHVYEANKKGKKNKRSSWIKSLLNKGEKPIIQIVDEVEGYEWEFWEKYWINQFRSWGFNLVNDSDGGEGAYGRLVTDETKLKMSLAKKGKTPKNIDLFKKSTIKGAVIQYDLKGNKIGEYESSNYVKEVLKIKNVCNVIHKKRNTAGGYIWRFKGDELSEKEIKEIQNKHLRQEKKIVYQISKDNKLIKEWSSVNEIKKIYPHINGVLSGRRKTAGGYFWVYKIN